MPVNNPANIRHGLIVRDDLSFEESIVVELKLVGIFFLPFYIVLLFLTIPVKLSWQILKIYILIAKRLEYLSQVISMHIHSQFWWPDGDTTFEGNELEEVN